MTGKQLKNAILQLAIQGKLVPPACRLAGKTRPTSQLPTEETGVWYVYVIECEDGSFYKGFTTNLQKRYKEHCSGRGAEWTKKHKPKQLYYYEIQYSEEAALKREKYLKSGSGREWFKREVVDKSDDWEPASVLLAQIRKEKEQLVKAGKLILSKPEKGIKPISQSEYTLPKNWTSCQLVDVCRVFGRIGFRGYTKNDLVNSPKKGAISISPSNMKDYGMDYNSVTYITWAKYEESPEIKIYDGDILIVKTGSSYGKCVLVENLPHESTINPQIAVIKDIKVYSKYLLYFLQSPFAREKYEDFVLGTSIPTFSQLNLLSMEFPLPPLAEQHRIVAKIEELMPLVEEYGVAQEKLDRLNEALPEALKKSILQQAIQGKLVPPACRLAGKTRPTSQLPTEETGVWYVYVIECEDGSFYKGFTTNLQKRYKEHCSGRGAEWTKKHKPKQLYYYEIQYSEEAALKREKYLKSGSGREWFKREVVDKSDDWEPASALLARLRKEKEQLLKAGKLKHACRQAGKKDLATTPITDEEKPFEIPERWEWVRLGEIGSWGSGATPAKGKPEYYYNGTIPWLRTGELNNGYVFDSEIKVTQKALDNCSLRMCSKGDVLIAMYGATIGKVAIAGIELTTNQACCACTPIIIFNEYLMWYLLASKQAFIELGEGGAQPNISREKIVAFPFALPPLAEQHRIVSKIEELMPLVEGMK